MSDMPRNCWKSIRTIIAITQVMWFCPSEEMEATDGEDEGESLDHCEPEEVSEAAGRP